MITPASLAKTIAALITPTAPVPAAYWAVPQRSPGRPSRTGFQTMKVRGVKSAPAPAASRRALDDQFRDQTAAFAIAQQQLAPVAAGNRCGDAKAKPDAAGSAVARTV